MKHPEKRWAFIYNDKHSGDLLAKLVLGAERAPRWQPIPFTRLFVALEELDESMDAVIAAVGPDLSAPSFNGREVLLRAGELEIPRAIVTTSTLNSDWVREESSDLVIPRGPGAHIPEKIADWLIHLPEKTEPPQA